MAPDTRMPAQEGEGVGREIAEASIRQAKESTSGDKFLKLLSNPVNIKILCLISTSSVNLTVLAGLLGIRASHVSEHLKSLRSAGLLIEKRERTQGNKSVKMYSLNVEALEIRFDALGPSIALKQTKSERSTQRSLASVDILAKQVFYKSDIPATELFVGRSQELASLTVPTNVFSVIWGMPGIGKTTLVATAARRLSESRPTFWHDIREVDTLNYVITKLAVFFSILGRNELLNLVRSTSSQDDQRVKIDLAIGLADDVAAVLAFDDYHFCKDDSVKMFLRELASKSSAKSETIVISRTRPTDLISVGIPSTTCEIRLDGLIESEARQLLNIQLGSKMSDSQNSSATSIDNRTLMNITKGHPLLVRILSQSSRVLNESSSQVLLTKSQEAAEEYLSSQLFDVMDSDELDVLKTTSVFREAVEMEGVRRMCSSLVRGIPHIISKLERRGVAIRVGTRVAFHDLVRETAYKFLDDPKVFHKKAASYYLESKDTRSRLEALHHLVEAGEFERAKELINKFGYFFFDEGFSSPYIEIIEKILENPKAGEGIRGYAIKVKADSLQLAGSRLEEALHLFEEAERLGRQTRDDLLCANALLKQAYALRDLGEIEKAGLAFRRGLETTEVRSIDPQLAGDLSEGFAEVLIWKGKLGEAIQRLTDSLQIRQKIADDFGILISTLNRGVCYHMKSEFDLALADMSKSYDEGKRMGNKRIKAYSSFALALLKKDMYRENEALNHFKEAIEEFDAISINSFLMEAFSERAIFYCKGAKNPSLAKQDISRATELRPSVDRKESIGVYEMALGMLAAKESKFVESKSHFAQAEKFLQMDPSYLARLFWLRGLAELEQRNNDQVLRYLGQAKEIYVSMGSKKFVERIEADIQRNMENMSH